MQQQVPEKEWSLILDEFEGCATVFDDVVMGKKYAKEALNMRQVQDGRWKERPGRAYYGSELVTEFLDAEEYIKTDGTRELVAIGVNGKAYKSTDGGAWTEIAGATFTIGAKNIFFKQINNYLFICNGVDRLTRYNGTVLTRYASIGVPTGLAGARGTGLTSGSNNNFYQVSALNEVGETVACAEVSVPTNKIRDVWNVANNEYVDLSWTAVSGAIAYQIYYSDVSGKCALLANVTTNSYRDDNSSVINPYRVAQIQDTTGAPKFSMIASSGSRIWGIAPKEHPYTVFYSGTGAYLGYFGDAFGGGWTYLDFGGSETVSFVEHFRTGKGDSAATVFTKSPKGGGSVWQIPLQAQTFGDEVIIVANPEKIVGSMGANAPGAALLVGDTIMFLSAQGINSLSNKENVSNVLSTTPQSAKIRPSYLGLNFKLSDQFRAYDYQNYIFFTATEGVGENDLIFLYDKALDRWYWKWTFGVRGFLEYTENTSGETKFLLVPTGGNQLVECSEDISGDFGQSFFTSFLTGLISIDRDQSVFARMSEALLSLGRPKGTIQFEVLGNVLKKGFLPIGSRVVAMNTVTANEFWTGDLGEITLMDEEEAPISYAQASETKTVKIKGSVNKIQFYIYSNTAGTEYTVLTIQAKGVIDSVSTPSNWKK